MNRSILNLLFIVFTLASTHSFGQRYSNVTPGNDSSTNLSEQVADDVSTMNEVIAKYEIPGTRLQSNLENYQFWVSFIKENKISIKRKKLITDFLGNMKRELIK